MLRGKEFSPLKNGDSVGELCTTATRNDTYTYHKKLIKKADGISTLLTYAGENLEKLVKGKTPTSPVYFKSDREVVIVFNGHA